MKTIKEGELQTHLYHPSSNYILIDSYKTNISQQLKVRITQACIKPITSHYISHGVDQILAQTENTLNEHIHNYRLKNVILDSLDKVSIDKKEKVNSQNNIEENTELIDIPIQSTSEGDEGTILHAHILALQCNAPVVIYDESGERLHVIGNETQGQPIELTYTPPTDGKPGHWAPKNIQEYTKSVQGNNCLFDAIAAVINARDTNNKQKFNGQVLRNICVTQIKANRNSIAPCVDALYILSTQNPADVYMGAGIINDAIDACMYCEKNGWNSKKAILNSLKP